MKDKPNGVGSLSEVGVPQIVQKIVVRIGTLVNYYIRHNHKEAAISTLTSFFRINNFP